MAGSVRIRVLLVAGESGDAELAATRLEREGDRFVVETATGVGEGRDVLAGTEAGVDCVVSDHDAPAVDGSEFLETIRRERSDLPVMSGASVRGSPRATTKRRSTPATRPRPRGPGSG